MLGWLEGEVQAGMGGRKCGYADEDAPGEEWSVVLVAGEGEKSVVAGSLSMPAITYAM